MESKLNKLEKRKSSKLSLFTNDIVLYIVEPQTLLRDYYNPEDSLVKLKETKSTHRNQWLLYTQTVPWLIKNV